MSRSSDLDYLDHPLTRHCYAQRVRLRGRLSHLGNMLTRELCKCLQPGTPTRFCKDVRSQRRRYDPNTLPGGLTRDPSAAAGSVHRCRAMLDQDPIDKSSKLWNKRWPVFVRSFPLKQFVCETAFSPAVALERDSGVLGMADSAVPTAAPPDAAETQQQNAFWRLWPNLSSAQDSCLDQHIAYCNTPPQQRHQKLFASG